ncbi:MAG: type transport system ATP-binding protein [Gaiellaceae bacterium]|jgi:ABC-2 type transport system ATP-binding protein|nr:type transport system ATP-binding protein [Gaiellaceae bacterium]
MSAVVEAHGVRKEYASLVAVEDLSFAVEAGEILGVLGPNGAGKTTAIRVLTTILSPTRGSFQVARTPHTRPAEIRKIIGVLPESAGYPEQQTGEEFLRFYGRLYGQSRASAAAVATALLAEAGLTERGHSLVTTYSRGMRQRLGLARALVNDPQVVFLDEPTLGLDPAGQRQVLALVRGLAEERGATVLLSTHLHAEVEELCTRVLILNRGRVAAEGTVSEVARMAAAPRSARVRVRAERVEDALGALVRANGVETVERADGQPGWLVVVFTSAGEESGSAALLALAEADVPVLAFELEGARLSDAFLAMTGAG